MIKKGTKQTGHLDYNSLQLMHALCCKKQTTRSLSASVFQHVREVPNKILLHLRFVTLFSRTAIEEAGARVLTRSDHARRSRQNLLSRARREIYSLQVEARETHLWKRHAEANAMMRQAERLRRKFFPSLRLLPNGGLTLKPK